MKVLILSPYPERISPAIEAAGDEWCRTGESGWTDVTGLDWIVSFGHPKLVSGYWIERHQDRLINIHISLLPHNRGSDPNFWSWYDNTPKGVTIHQITKGLDTGPILAQREIKHMIGHTLRSSYDVLMREAAALFADTWPQIRAGQITPIPQPKQGSYHRQADKEPLMKNLPGWDATCEEVERMGQRAREVAA